MFNDQAPDEGLQLDDEPNTEPNTQPNTQPNTESNTRPNNSQSNPPNNSMRVVGRNPIVLIERRAKPTELALSTNQIAPPEALVEDIILEEVLFTSKDITNPKNYAQVLRH